MNTVNSLIQAVQLAAILVLGYANLDYGCGILQFYLQRKDGDLHRALAAYNGSTGSPSLQRQGLAWNRHWRTEPLDWSR